MRTQEWKVGGTIKAQTPCIAFGKVENKSKSARNKMVAAKQRAAQMQTNDEKSEKTDEKFSEQFSQSLWRKVDKFSMRKAK